jgi:ubiquinone/menaquinone biosynthesis C-methylase UbiE
LPTASRGGSAQNGAVSQARDHWQSVYSEKDPTEVSWYERAPTASLRLIEEAGLPRGRPLLDVGGGASKLAGALLSRGYSDVTVADISASALSKAQAQLGSSAKTIEWMEADVRSHDFARQYDLWHDRAVFHFMVGAEDQEAYLDTLQRTLKPGGHVVIATFGPDGPNRCSGLPVVRYGSAGVAERLGPGFQPISEVLHVHDTPAGSHQQFLYAHFQRNGER